MQFPVKLFQQSGLVLNGRIRLPFRLLGIQSLILFLGLDNGLGHAVYIRLLVPRGGRQLGMAVGAHIMSRVQHVQFSLKNLLMFGLHVLHFYFGHAELHRFQLELLIL